MAFWNKTETRNVENKLDFGGVEITVNGQSFGGMSVNEKTNHANSNC